MSTNERMEDIICANNASAGYPGHAVWSKANFCISRGDFVGVLGPNGAGKTTLFRILLGLLPPLSGEVLLFGKKPERGNPRIGYVPQRHSVDSDTLIESLEIVRLGLYGNTWGFDSRAQARESTERAISALRDVGAEDLAHRPLGFLSGGELQRIFLAQALVGDPDILLLDEPLANLDIRREAELVDLIRAVVKARGVTVLLIAHNINPLLSALNRVMYVANGKIATGDPSEVLNSNALSALYGAPVEVLRDSRGRIAIVGEGEGHHHE